MDAVKSYRMIPCLLIVLLVGMGAVFPFRYDNIVIEEGGAIWIEGTAGPVQYKCEAQRLSGVGEIENTREPTSNIQREDAVEITVKFPVRALDCGKEAMNQDMYEALKAGDFPTISYQLLETQMSGGDRMNHDGWMDIRTKGVMTIAGVGNTTFVNVKGKLLSRDRFRVKGSKKISMETYKVDPPTALLGLIKADEELTVHFDVTVRLTG